MKRFFSIVVIFLWLFTSVQADPAKNWFYDQLRSDTPDDFYYVVYTDSRCPYSDSEYMTAIEGEIIRSLLTPIRELPLGKPYLSVGIACMQTSPSSPSYAVVYDISYAITKYDGADFYLAYEQYGGITLDSTPKLVNPTLRGYIYNAITDYLEAHQ